MPVINIAYIIRIYYYKIYTLRNHIRKQQQMRLILSRTSQNITLFLLPQNIQRSELGNHHLFTNFLLYLSYFLWNKSDQFQSDKINKGLKQPRVKFIQNKQIQRTIMAYNHSYSNYVNHILNKSPSRTTYSFNKSERFKDNQSFNPQNDPFLLYNKKQSPGKVNNHFNNGYQIDQERQMHRKPTNMEFYNQRDLQRGKSKSVQNRKKGVKKTSPFKKYNNNVNEMNYRTQFYQKESSPYKKSPYKYSPSKNDSYKNSQRKKSPSKTYIQHLQEIDHPLKKMTIGGYYPTGVQLSPNGKYINSKIRNVSSYSFSKGSLGNRYDNSQNNQDPLGPGYYTAFSQFGQSRRR